MTDYKSPQLEDGYIRIANELYDAIFSFPLPASMLRVLMIVVRKTYGYGKKEDDMSASQIGEMCAMSRQHVTTALNDLAALMVIHKRPGRFGSIIGINKDYSSWIASPNLGQVNKSRTSPKLGQVSDIRSIASPNLGQVDSPNLGHTKDNLPKDNQQKKPPCANADAFSRFWDAYPKRKSKAQAEKAFAKLNPDEQLMAEILEAIERAKTSEQWRKSGGQYIPHPATWLNAKGWEDEHEAAGQTDEIAAQLFERLGVDVIPLPDGRYRAGWRFFDANGRPEVVF